MSVSKKSHWDNIVIGMMAGFMVPLFLSPVIAWVFLQFTRYNKGFWSYFDDLFKSPDTAASLVSLSVLCNLIPFGIFYYVKWDKAMKGTILLSILYAILVFVLKLI